MEGHNLAGSVAAAVANLAVVGLAANSVVAVVAVVAVANPAEHTLDHSHTAVEHIAQLAHTHPHYHRFLLETLLCI